MISCVKSWQALEVVVISCVGSWQALEVVVISCVKSWQALEVVGDQLCQELAGIRSCG